MRSIHDAEASPARRVTRLEVALGTEDPFRSLSFHRLGQNDRATRRGHDHFEKVFRGPTGPARVSIERIDRGVSVELESMDADHDAMLPCVPGVLGLEDTAHADFEVPAEADPRRVLRDVRLRARGLRHVRVPWLYELLVLIVIQQRVAFDDAMRSHR